MTAPSSTASLVQERETLRRRCARSAALRLLSGAGAVELVAFREDPDHALPILAHGLTRAGKWAVVLTDAPAGPLSSVRVRIDQVGVALDVRVIVASLHALGEMHVLDDDEAARLLSEGEMDDLVAAAGQAEGARIALIQLDDVLIHARGGVEKIAVADICHRAVFPRVQHEWDAVDAVAQLCEASAPALVGHVREGLHAGIAGEAVMTLPGVITPHSMMLLDVDSQGCTWLDVHAEEARAVFVAFDAPVFSEAALTEALAGWRRLAGARPQ